VIALSVTWRPEDQAWLLAAQDRRDAVLGVAGWTVLAGAALLALAMPVASRLAAWAAFNLHDPAPLLRPPGQVDLAVAGTFLGLGLVFIVLSRWGQRFGLRTMLEARMAEGREPLLGPVAVTLAPGGATFRGAAWETSFDAALLTAMEEAPEHLVLRFGPTRPVMLPRRDLTATETAAVRDWATLALGAEGRSA